MTRRLLVLRGMMADLDAVQAELLEREAGQDHDRLGDEAAPGHGLVDPVPDVGVLERAPLDGVEVDLPGQRLVDEDAERRSPCPSWRSRSRAWQRTVKASRSRVGSGVAGRSLRLPRAAASPRCATRTSLHAAKSAADERSEQHPSSVEPGHGGGIVWLSGAVRAGHAARLAAAVEDDPHGDESRRAAAGAAARRGCSSRRRCTSARPGGRPGLWIRSASASPASVRKTSSAAARVSTKPCSAGSASTSRSPSGPGSTVGREPDLHRGHGRDRAAVPITGGRSIQAGEAPAAPRSTWSWTMRDRVGQLLRSRRVATGARTR